LDQYSLKYKVGGNSVNTKPVSGSLVNRKSFSGSSIISKVFGGNLYPIFNRVKKKIASKGSG
jgi:hypothetical protein